MTVLEVISFDQFESIVLKDSADPNSKKYVVLDVYASWCGPCLKFAPTYEELSNTYGDKFHFLKVNLDTVPEIKDQYGITSLPTFLLFDVGSLESPYKPITGTNKTIIEERLKSIGKEIKISEDF